jgi:glyoxalase family protein
MPEPIVGLHHVTAIASDPQRNLVFYPGALGLRFVKRTVNFDDPGSYHFYFGDDAGSPGTILTFFAWPRASRGRVGTGETSAVASSVPASSLDFWERRNLAAGAHVTCRGTLWQSRPQPWRSRRHAHRTRWLGQSLTWSRNAYKRYIRSAGDRELDGVTLTQADYESTASVLEKMGLAWAAQEGNRIRFVSLSTATGTASTSSFSRRVSMDARVQEPCITSHSGRRTTARNLNGVRRFPKCHCT